MAQESTELVFGLHAVEAALRHQPEEVEALWLDTHRRDRGVEALRSRAEAVGIPVHSAGRKELDQMVTGARHQGAVARVRAASVGSEQDLDRLLEGLSEPPFLLILDGVQDPHNLGACLRSADAAGVHAVIAPKDRAVSLTATVRKVASGAAETVPFIQVTNLARTLEQLKQAGVWLTGLAGEGDQTLYQIDLKGPLALVMGAEGSGLRRLTREHCDFLARIPMAGTVESLNVSVAAGICLFEAVRQRNG